MTLFCRGGPPTGGRGGISPLGINFMLALFILPDRQKKIKKKFTF